MERAHLVVAGEKAERSAVSDAQNTLDGFCGGLDEFGFARVGHGGRQIKESLLTVLKVRRNDELARAQFVLGEAETTAEVLKAALHGERGGGENDGGDLVEDKISNT